MCGCGVYVWVQSYQMSWTALWQQIDSMCFTCYLQTPQYMNIMVSEVCYFEILHSIVLDCAVTCVHVYLYSNTDGPIGQMWLHWCHVIPPMTGGCVHMIISKHCVWMWYNLWYVPHINL